MTTGRGGAGVIKAGNKPVVIGAWPGANLSASGIEPVTVVRTSGYVLCDQAGAGMPHMTGETLAEKLVKIRPDIPIILCTGFGNHFNKKAVLDGED